MREVLIVGGNSQPEVDITVHTMREFGSAEDVEVVIYVKGNANGKRIGTTIGVGEATSVTLKGTRGYCRIATQTTGQGGERLYCFPNPIWLWNPDDRTMRLRVRVEQQGN